MHIFHRKHHQKKRTLGKQAGFTIVELLIAISLMGGFVVVLTDVISATLDVQLESEATSATTEDLRYLTSRLDYDLQRANSITTPAAQGASASTLVLVIDGVTYTYALSGSTLQVSSTLGTFALTSNESNISSISFQKIGNVGGKDTIRFQFTISSVTVTDQGQGAKTYTLTFGRRE